MALAQPAGFESLSLQKPGQSHGFQAKQGQNITRGNGTMGKHDYRPLCWDSQKHKELEAEDVICVLNNIIAQMGGQGRDGQYKRGIQFSPKYYHPAGSKQGES